MKRDFLHIILGGLLASVMTACQQDVPNVEQTDEDASRIYLSAGIGNSESTRAPYYPTDGNGEPLHAPTLEHPLNVSVWASTTSGTYPNSELNGNNDDGTVAIHTDAHFQSGDPQLLGEAIYPKAQTQGETAKKVYFVGLHPLSNQTNSWTATNDNKDAQFTFTGKEDVMFAPQISGSYGTEFDQSPQFHFYHLLTWLRISMVAYLGEDEENSTTLTEDEKKLKREKVSNAWGKITELTLKNQKDIITISNLGEATTSNYTSHVTFATESSDKSFALYHTGTDDVFPGTNRYAIPVNKTDAAYVMCAPVLGKEEDKFENPVPEYTLHIKTEHREMDIPLDLKGDERNLFTGSTMGRVFNILLRFKMGDVISVSTEISVGGDADWFTHGTGTGDLTEDNLKSNAGNN